MIRPLLFDSLSEKLCEVYSPTQLTVYVCGVTVYDYCHVGHGRVKIVYDVWRRWMEYNGQKICFVTNITDIDDKIIHKAQSTGRHWKELADQYIALMHQDDLQLGLLPPDHAPRATEYIPAMIALIERLLASGHGYLSADGDVCMNIQQCAHYGMLSKQNSAFLQTHQASDAKTTDKKNSADFVLWKHAKPGEPSWASPWGEGRPGWHLECSAMAEQVLGHPIDLHGGGMDLKFPHHENEIAQSEACFGAPFAKHWMHVGLVDRDGVKMSKSLGNTMRLQDAIAHYGAPVLRLFYIKSHYSKPIAWSDSALEETVSRYHRYVRACQYYPDAQSAAKNKEWSLWMEALGDDFNTPKALSIMDRWAKKAGLPLKNAPRNAARLRRALVVLGVALPDHSADVAWIETQIARRTEAKREKSFDVADGIRDILAKRGIFLEDTAEGVRWFKSSEEVSAGDDTA